MKQVEQFETAPEYVKILEESQTKSEALELVHVNNLFKNWKTQKKQNRKFKRIQY